MLSKVLRIILFSSLALLLAGDPESAELDSIEHLVGEVSIAAFQQQPIKSGLMKTIAPILLMLKYWKTFNPY